MLEFLRLTDALTGIAFLGSRAAFPCPQALYPSAVWHRCFQTYDPVLKG